MPTTECALQRRQRRLGRRLAELRAQPDRISSSPGDLATLHSTNTISPTPVQRSVRCGQPEHTELFRTAKSRLVNRNKLGITFAQRNPALNPLNMIPDMTFSSIQNYANPSLSDGTAVLQPEHASTASPTTSARSTAPTSSRRASTSSTPRRSRAPARRSAATSASTRTATIPTTPTIPTPMRCSDTIDSYSEALTPSAVELSLHQHRMVLPGRLESQAQLLHQLGCALLSRSAAVRCARLHLIVLSRPRGIRKRRPC